MFADRVDIAARRLSRPQGYRSSDIVHRLQSGKANRTRLLSGFKIIDSELKNNLSPQPRVETPKLYPVLPRPPLPSPPYGLSPRAQDTTHRSPPIRLLE